MKSRYGDCLSRYLLLLCIILDNWKINKILANEIAGNSLLYTKFKVYQTGPGETKWKLAIIFHLRDDKYNSPLDIAQKENFLICLVLPNRLIDRLIKPDNKGYLYLNYP